MSTNPVPPTSPAAGAAPSNTGIAKEPIEFIVEHYHKTHELAYELRNDRNNIFIILVAFLATATLLFSLGQPQVNSLLVVWIAKTVGVTDQNQIAALQSSANFDLLQVFVLAVVFYLTVNLYHHTQTVLRLYAYLGKMEGEIRERLGLDATTISFTRESSFYWNKRPRLMGLVATVYIIIVFVLLAGFLALRLIDDWQTEVNLFKVADVILMGAIAIYFVGYATASSKS